MDESIKKVILQSSEQIADNCNKEEYIVSHAGRRLPSRGAVIGIIKELRRVMFPGYFGDENITIISPKYFLSDCITNIYMSLRRQVEAALIYREGEEACLMEVRDQADEICKAFIAKLPDIQQMLLKDVDAGFDGDPAAKSKEDIVFSYPGLYAIFVYRVAHELYLQKVPYLPRIMTEHAHSKTGIDINAGATIGEYFFIDHGTGVVIGETAHLGNHVKLYQGVTLGALSTREGQKLRGTRRHPTIEDNVTIYAGATVLGGDTVIGEGSIIAGSAFVTESMPAHSKVLVKTPELMVKGGKNLELKKEPTWEDGLWEI